MSIVMTKPTKWHPPSLIRVFAVHMKKAWVLRYPLSAQRRLIRLVILLVLSWGGSNHLLSHSCSQNSTHYVWKGQFIAWWFPSCGLVHLQFAHLEMSEIILTFPQTPCWNHGNFVEIRFYFCFRRRSVSSSSSSSDDDLILRAKRREEEEKKLEAERQRLQ